jgi:hypothetical protein
VRFFAGDDRDAFVHAVRANTTHGLPLSLADRTAAAGRIVLSHPEWSDRVIAEVSGLAHQTVGEIRKRATGGSDQLHARVGRDGRTRPLDSNAGRIRAARLISEDPKTSLRQIANHAGISPGKARDVRERLNRGEDPVLADRLRSAPAKPRPSSDTGSISTPTRRTGKSSDRDVASVIQALRKDPSLRFSESGRALLRLLDGYVVLKEGTEKLAANIPSHCAESVTEAAYGCAAAWQQLAGRIVLPPRED